MVLEGLDSSFSRVCSVVARGDELIFDAGFPEVFGECVGDLIIEANFFGVKTRCGEGLVANQKGSDHFLGFSGCHRFGVDVI